jgi:hypothetical protein
MNPNQDEDPLGFDPIASSHNSGATISSVTTLAAPAHAKKLMIQALTQNVRITLDGTAATTSVGFQLKAGDPVVIFPLGPHSVIKVIEETATASLQYCFGY